MPKKIEPAGNRQEQELFDEVSSHYDMAKEDLEARLPQMDKNDELFRSYIDKDKWPYRTVIFDPRVFTALMEKIARQFANKPQGRMTPREGGDVLGAKINNELLMWQWDDNARVDDMAMVIKWAMMALNARRYGVSYGLANWHWQRQIQRNKGDNDKPTGKSVVWYDGPNFRQLNNRDSLPNPSYSNIKNWFQHRDYVTWQELENVNDMARGKPIYKNLDILRDQIKQKSRKGGDSRESNYTSRNLTIRGLTDYLGQDEVYKTIEVVTEYRNERWIRFAPKYGVILKDIPNPYDHGQIPIIQLKYNPIDEDQSGVSDIEPVEKLQRAINAYICQNLDTLNMSTYTPIKVRKTAGAVQMHTLEFGPAVKWMMDNPSEDVVSHVTNPQGVREFPLVYRLLVSAFQEGMGEASVGVSGAEPGQTDKTATEIKDTAIQRNAKDNFNQIFLYEAIKKQMTLWHSMNQQFLFSTPTERTKIIRITGKDAIKYFQQMGLDTEGFSDESIDMLSNPDLVDTVQPSDLAEAVYPVSMNGQTVPKFSMDEDNQSGQLIIEPEDLAGNYDYIPDIQSMAIPNDTQLMAAAKQMTDIATIPATSQLLAQEGYTLNYKDMLEDFFERLGFKDADKYFKKLEVNTMQNAQTQGQAGQPVPGGAGVAQGGSVPVGANPNQGMAARGQALPNGQA